MDIFDKVGKGLGPIGAHAHYSHHYFIKAGYLGTQRGLHKLACVYSVFEPDLMSNESVHTSRPSGRSHRTGTRRPSHDDKSPNDDFDAKLAEYHRRLAALNYAQGPAKLK